MKNNTLDLFRVDKFYPLFDNELSLFENVIYEQDKVKQVSKQKIENDFSIFENYNNDNEYTLISKIENSSEKNIVPIKEFVQSLVNKSNIKLDLFYYPITEHESILVLNNYIHDEQVIKSLCDFCDINNIILSIDTLEILTPKLKKLGFIENDNIYINEYILRHPIKLNMNEGVMIFGGLSQQVNAVDLSSTNVQSYTYKEEWFKDYLEIINSEEFKKRRYKETHGVLINRNAKRQRGCASKVGFAIIGKSKIV